VRKAAKFRQESKISGAHTILLDAVLQLTTALYISPVQRPTNPLPYPEQIARDIVSNTAIMGGVTVRDVDVSSCETARRIETSIQETKDNERDGGLRGILNSITDANCSRFTGSNFHRRLCRLPEETGQATNTRSVNSIHHCAKEQQGGIQDNQRLHATTTELFDGKLFSAAHKQNSQRNNQY
jgi:hypothetical protein